MVGQRRQNEIVCSQHVPLEALQPSRMHVRLQNPADQVLRARAVEVVEEPPDRLDEARAENLGRADPVEDKGPAVGRLEGLGEQLPVYAPDALVSQRLGECVVLFLGLLRPQDVVEEQPPMFGVLGGRLDRDDERSPGGAGRPRIGR